MTQAKLCFENSSCKRLSFNNSANSSWAWQVYNLLKFQLCISPESKSKALLKLCVKLLTLVETTRCALKAVSLAPK